MTVGSEISSLLVGATHATRFVPPAGFTSRLTILSAAAMGFLAVFAIALSLATDRLADRWASELARTATVRISAPAGQVETQTAAVLDVLASTPGVASARELDATEVEDLLAPWFGPDLPLDSLPVPALVEVVSTAEGFDTLGLRLRLSAEAPGALLDDHTQWREPLVRAANRLQLFGWFAIALIAAATAAMVTLAANSALAANEQVIRVMRLIGARDTQIARAFVRRFTLRTLLGAAIGAIVASAALLVLPDQTDGAEFLTGLGIRGADWLWVLLVPVLAALVSFVATRFAAFSVLRGLN